MAMVLAGVVIGLGVTAIFTRSISGLLYGIRNFDAISFFVSAIVLIVVAFPKGIVGILETIRHRRQSSSPKSAVLGIESAE